MIIRETQQQILAAGLQKRFEDKMVIHILSAFTKEAEGWKENDLRGFIQLGINKAFSYEIKIEADVSRFIEYMLCYGENFDLDENLRWFQPVLNSKKLNGTQKMDAIDSLNYIALSYGNQ